MSELPTIQILRPNDNWEAVYINEILLIEAHSVSAEDLIGALQREGIFKSLDVFDICDDSEEEEFEHDEKGNCSYAGALIWKSGEGCPSEWPFELDDQKE